MITFTYYTQENFTHSTQENSNTIVKKLFKAMYSYVSTKKREFCNQEIKTLLLCVKMLASMSLKVCSQNAKPLSHNLQNIQLYSCGGVDDFRAVATHNNWVLFWYTMRRKQNISVKKQCKNGCVIEPILQMPGQKSKSSK
jgi:hypothetical protein